MQRHGVLAVTSARLQQCERAAVHEVAHCREMAVDTSPGKRRKAFGITLIDINAGVREQLAKSRYVACRCREHQPCAIIWPVWRIGEHPEVRIASRIATQIETGNDIGGPAHVGEKLEDRGAGTTASYKKCTGACGANRGRGRHVHGILINPQMPGSGKIGNIVSRRALQ